MALRSCSSVPPAAIVDFEGHARTGVAAMPPIRTVPTVKPVRTERTHEENQERAYIAASRRSDRSLEARVESARRASEIHKKRTGRSLRVREEDVMNEEMYEEEDDDLPMQFRRINALHPGLAFNPAFSDRVNSYLAGQIGVRNYLHQAIYQANQSQYNNHFLNPMMQQNAFQNPTMQPQAMNAGPQSPWPMNMQNVHPSSHARSASIATPQGFASQQQSGTPNALDTRRMSFNATSPGATSPAISHSRSAQSSQPPTPHPLVNTGSSPKQVPTPPHSKQTAASPVPSTASADQNIYPLTTTLPIESQQLLDGHPGFTVPCYQMTPGVPMPSMGAYSYNPNGKSAKRDSGSGRQGGLNQTLTPFYPQNTSPHSSFDEPQSAASAPANLDFSFNQDMYGGMNMSDSKYAFNMDFGSGTNSGQITPAAGLDSAWNPDDFFNYSAASD
ncbi:hypothetical protein AC579_2600 [Pseudocercospora musae]|uniref:Uncharacterized protein n=2 Tax=Pseudocercospora musae TaxID=113226 RepID=A0A139I1T2_9PEZI|nr:hypothetical protein AC579_2600 [Pseudocercospora musae]